MYLDVYHGIIMHFSRHVSLSILTDGGRGWSGGTGYSYSIEKFCYRLRRWDPSL
jgi:hypothetical protein